MNHHKTFVYLITLTTLEKFVYMHACVCVHVHACVCACMHECVHTCMHFSSPAWERKFSGHHCIKQLHGNN